MQNTGHIQRDKSLLAAALIAVFTFLVFSPVLLNDFVNWDDEANFVFNQSYRGLGFAQLKWAFTTLHMGHYMPLTWLSSGLDYVLWGMNPGGYHLTSLVLHSLNAGLFYLLVLFLLRYVLKKHDDAELKLAAAFGALFFAVHPLRTESVAWATERRDVLSGAFMFSALLYYARHAVGEAGKHLKGKSLALFACAVLSRENSAAFMPALLLLDVYPFRRLPANPLRWGAVKYRPVLLEKLPFFFLALFGTVLASAATIYSLPPEGAFPVPAGHRAALFIYGLAFYLRKTLLPFDLAPLYEPGPHFGLLSAPVLGSAALLLLAGGAIFALRRRYPALVVCGLIYGLFLLPTLGIAHTLSMVYDRYSYSACLGWAVCAAAGAALSLKWGVRVGEGFNFRRVVVGCLLAGGIFHFSLLSFFQSMIWKNSLTLWSHTISAVDGPNESAYLNRGQEFLRRGAYAAALQDYNHVLELNPRASDAYLNRAVARQNLGELPGAEEDFDTAWQLDSSNLRALFGRGLLALERGRAKTAVDDFTFLLNANFMRAEVLAARARAYAELGLERQARADADAAALLPPTPAQPQR